MPDYSLGKIYKITAKNADEGDVYFGSTCGTLHQRFYLHKYNKKYNSKILFNKYGIDNCYIELIKDFPCETKNELLTEEAKYIQEYKCVNKYTPLHTHHQWYLENADRIKEKSKIRYYELKKQGIKRILSEETKKKTSERQCQKITCECGSVVIKQCLIRHKLTQVHQKNLKVNISESL